MKLYPLRLLLIFIYAFLFLDNNTAVSSTDSSISNKQINDNRTFIRNTLITNEGFLGWASDQFATKLSNVSNQSPVIKEVLEGEYPKLLKLILDLERRVNNTLPSNEFLNNYDQYTLPVHQTISELPSCLVRTLQPFETAYLSRSVSRLFDRVTLAFSTSTTTGPDTNELNDIVQTAVSELAYATVHHDLLLKVTRNLDKLIALFATKTEALISNDISAVQLIDPQTPGQQNNIHLINLLCQFGTNLQLSVNKRLNNLNVVTMSNNHYNKSLLNDNDESPITETLRKSPFQLISESTTNHLNSLCISILNPLLSAVSKQIVEILDSMQHEYNAYQDLSVNECSKSKYLQDLQNFTARVRQNYLYDLSKPSKFFNTTMSNLFTQSGCYACGEFALQDALKSFLGTCVDNFLWRLTLIRSSNESIRLKLAADCSEFELALIPLCCPNYGYTLMKLLPESYKQLREFPSVLSLENEQLIKTYTKESANHLLPSSLICQHIFSRAPDEIHYPHAITGWSVSYYISWLLKRKNDKERLVFLRNGLSAYAHEVQLRQQREYPPIYLQLKEFLDYHLENDQK